MKILAITFNNSFQVKKGLGAKYIDTTKKTDFLVGQYCSCITVTPAKKVFLLRNWYVNITLLFWLQNH